MPLIYPVGFLGARKGPLLTGGPVAQGTSASFSANLGAAGSDLYVVVAVMQANTVMGGPVSVPTGITVGGVALTLLNDAGAYTCRCNLWGGFVPAGGVQAVAVAGGNLGSDGFGADVYAVRGSTGLTLNAIAGGSNQNGSASYSIDAQAGGVVIGAASGGGGAFTGLSSAPPSASTCRSGWYDAASANAAYPVTGSGNSIGLISLKP